LVAGAADDDSYLWQGLSLLNMVGGLTASIRK
jgi:hypothetical protein